jgi:hypothetical protein
MAIGGKKWTPEKKCEYCGGVVPHHRKRSRHCSPKCEYWANVPLPNNIIIEMFYGSFEKAQEMQNEEIKRRLSFRLVNDKRRRTRE